jgi:hypothetical protein
VPQLQESVVVGVMIPSELPSPIDRVRSSVPDSHEAANDSSASVKMNEYRVLLSELPRFDSRSTWATRYGPSLKDSSENVPLHALRPVTSRLSLASETSLETTIRGPAHPATRSPTTPGTNVFGFTIRRLLFRVTLRARHGLTPETADVSHSFRFFFG